MQYIHLYGNELWPNCRQCSGPNCIHVKKYGSLESRACQEPWSKRATLPQPVQQPIGSCWKGGAQQTGSIQIWLTQKPVRLSSPADNLIERHSLCQLIEAAPSHIHTAQADARGMLVLMTRYMELFHHAKG